MLSLATTAQQLLSYAPASASFVEECLPHGACGTAGVAPSRSFSGPALAPGAAMDGAVAIDDRRGIVFATSGSGSITRTRMPGLGCGSPAALVPLPIPSSIAVVRGMAVDPLSTRMFLTDGTTISVVDRVAGMAVLASFPSLMPVQLTGLCFDPATPTELLAVSVGADVVRYQISGGARLSVTPAPYASPGREATGLAIDRSAPSGGAIYVLHASGEIFDHTTGAVLRSGLVDRVGLAFVPSALRLPSAMSCAGGAAEPRLAALAVAGSTGFGVDLCGIPAGTAMALLLVGIPMVSSPIAIPAGRLWVGSAPIAFGIPVAAGSRAVHVPLSLGGLSAGMSFDVQWGLPCSSSAGGIVLTDALQVMVGR
jgi:hypothetical protein